MGCHQIVLPNKPRGIPVFAAILRDARKGALLRMRSVTAAFAGMTTC